MLRGILQSVSLDDFVPRRIIRLGMRRRSDGVLEATPAHQTLAQRKGRDAVARHLEDIAALPKRERVIKAGLAECGITQRPSDRATRYAGDAFAGEHRYAYEITAGDKVLHLGDPNPAIGEWFEARDVEVAEVDGHPVNVRMAGVTQAGYELVMHFQGNAQVRVLTGTHLKPIEFRKDPA